MDSFEEKKLKKLKVKSSLFILSAVVFVTNILISISGVATGVEIIMMTIIGYVLLIIATSIKVKI